uniref:Uncharacterized protein n=1 Tax=Nelumbo nucifera TaxID=4432 RepID=A0A822Y6K8_NELNU|nr:TPA_asm: hypothetical protein HUJ06_028729 [Nelumbo nucifera]
MLALHFENMLALKQDLGSICGFAGQSET